MDNSKKSVQEVDSFENPDSFTVNYAAGPVESDSLEAEHQFCAWGDDTIILGDAGEVKNPLKNNSESNKDA